MSYLGRRRKAKRGIKVSDQFGRWSQWVRGIVIVALVIYGGLVIIHLTNGFGFGSSLSMGVRDIRMAVTCPSEPGHVWDFVNRSPIAAASLGFGQALGEDPYKYVCKNGMEGLQ